MGFDLAWLLMKVTWIDMRFPTEVFIPIGLALGGVAGVFLFLNKLSPQVVRTFKIILLFLTALTVFTFLIDLKAAWFVAPIMVRSGLKLPFLNHLYFWIFLAVAVLLLFACLISTATCRNRDAVFCKKSCS